MFLRLAGGLIGPVLLLCSPGLQVVYAAVFLRCAAVSGDACVCGRHDHALLPVPGNHTGKKTPTTQPTLADYT